jgi:hypothetical protein
MGGGAEALDVTDEVGHRRAAQDADGKRADGRCCEHEHPEEPEHTGCIRRAVDRVHAGEVAKRRGDGREELEIRLG